MMLPGDYLRRTTSSTLMLVALCLASAGCSSVMKHSMPADRLPAVVRGPSKAARAPINLALLRQQPPPAHLIGPGDVLGIYVHGVVPTDVEADAPILQPTGNLDRDYYPPGGNVDTPNIGLPIPVQDDGRLRLPMLEPLRVEGLTLQQTSEAILRAYVQKQVVQPGRERVFVTLIKPRVSRVLVIREDISAPQPTLAGNNGVVPYAKRGDAHVVDLPVYENDVLHALAATGGLPGIDAYNEVWILRTEGADARLLEDTRQRVANGDDLQKVVTGLQSRCDVIRIPLWWDQNAPLPFGISDILLRSGDVVFIQARSEFFYTGGLLRGSQVPLPRDQDLDVVDAISLAGGSISGPPGGTAVFRAGAGPGFIIPPTRALIIRQLPDGQQVLIRVDLEKAMYDPMQRILIQPDDVVLLKYKPGEIMGNVALNMIGFNFAIDPFLR